MYMVIGRSYFMVLDLAISRVNMKLLNHVPDTRDLSLDAREYRYINIKNAQISNF